jgi:catecholate siderophore receptor
MEPIMQYRALQHRVLAFASIALIFNTARAADTELAPVVVNSTSGGSNMLRGSGSSATKLDVPLRDVPQSVQVVSKELIREQGALEMKEVLRNVSGVAPAQGEGRRDQFLIRGFDATRDTLIDGLRDDSLYFRDLGNIERVEVIKGPAAVLYGRGSAGGVINRVTKKPVFTPLREFTLSTGSDNLRRFDVDLGGGLSPSAAFRLTAAYEAGDSYRDVVESERSSLAPSIAWSLGKDTSFLLQTEFLRQSRTPDRGIPSLNGAPAPVPVGNFYGEKYDFADTNARNARLNVEHVFNADLTLRNDFQYSLLVLNALNTRTLGLTNNNTQVRRQTTLFPQDQSNYLNQTEVVYKLKLGTIEHTLLAGVELGYQKAGLRVRAANATAVSLQAPQQIMLMPNPERLPRTIDNTFEARTAAFYVQDQITFSTQWKALTGVRFDRFKQVQENRLSGLVQNRNESVLSPRIGLVYQPNESHAFYGNLSRSFQPAGNSLFFNGNNFKQIKPLESLQQEVGAKSEWLSGRLQSILALYQITQSNVVTNDPSDPAGQRQLQTGEQESRGLEIDVSANIQPGWKLYGNYALTLARITESNNFRVGNRLANIPRQAVNIGFNYELGHGFSIGGGASYIDERFAVEDNAVRLPSYVRFDAMFAYKNKAWEIGLNIKNLADKIYYESANNNNQIQPGASRSVLLYVRTKL